MDAMGEMVQDVGLAQSIQKGLPKNQMTRPAFGTPEDLEAKKAAVSGAAKMAVWDSALGKYLLQHFAVQREYDLSGASTGRRASTAALLPGDNTYLKGAPTEGTLATFWEEFTASKHFEIYCKYMILKDNTAANEITPKLFEEMRPLGASPRRCTQERRGGLCTPPVGAGSRRGEAHATRTRREVALPGQGGGACCRPQPLRRRLQLLMLVATRCR